MNDTKYTMRAIHDEAFARPGINDTLYIDGSRQTPAKLIDEMISAIDIDFASSSCLVMFDYSMATALLEAGAKSIVMGVNTDPCNDGIKNWANKYGVSIMDFRDIEEQNLTFDVIMANPPYQNNDGGSSIKLWKRFVVEAHNKWLKVDGQMAFVTPVSWSKPTRGIARGTDADLQNVMFGNTILYTNMDTSNHFPSVGVSTSAWVLRKDSIAHTNVYTPDAVKTAILNKLPSDNKIKLTKYTDTKFTRGITRVSEPTPKYKVPCAEKTGVFSYTDIDDISFRTKTKIHIPRNFGYDFIADNGEYGLGYQAECLVLNDNETIDGAMSYLTSKLVKFILSYKAWIPQPDYALVELLPRVDFSKVWSDDELYAHFGLTDEEVAYVEQNS